MAWLASITRLFTVPESAAADCYAAIVRQARRPAFYTTGQVADTPQGRFELVMLHAFLTMRRLHEQKAFNQTLFDLMFADFDINLRELGVGDLGVGKRVKSWAQAYRGRAAAYDASLSDSGELSAALGRNIYSGAEGKAIWLAAYVQLCVDALAKQDENAIMNGNIDWPTVAETDND